MLAKARIESIIEKEAAWYWVMEKVVDTLRSMMEKQILIRWGRDQRRWQEILKVVDLREYGFRGESVMAADITGHARPAGHPGQHTEPRHEVRCSHSCGKLNQQR